MRPLILGLLVGCVTPSTAGHAVIAAPAVNTRAITVEVTARGFVPDSVDVFLGSVTTLIFTRKVERTCVKRLVLGLDDEHTVERDLPIDQPVALTLKFDRVGELKFSCAMGMRFGSIRIVEPRRSGM